MPFNADGSYTGIDAATPHVLVVQKGYMGELKRGGQIQVPAGHVLRVQAMGATNALAAGAEPGEAVWIESTTAKIGDTLSAVEIATGIAAMAKKKAAIQAFHAGVPARAAKAAADKAAADEAALLAKIDARIAAHFAGKVAQPGTTG